MLEFIFFLQRHIIDLEKLKIHPNIQFFIISSHPKMSSLSAQLKTIKLFQTALKIGPNQQQPSILFDKHTARTTSIDTIYSMAILAYDKLHSHLSNSLEEVQNRQELLSEGLKEINRNTLTKEENSQLSRKLEKFIIQLAPYMLNSECQQVFEYLLRNFKINIFETEVLVLALLQYWNYEIYQKIIETVSKKQMTGKLTFLNQMASTQQINFTFILKTLTFSHSILDRLISIILEGSLLEIKTSADQVIHMSDHTASEHLLKHPLKNFLLKVFLTLIKEKRTNHFKYIIDFCSSCLRIKYPVSQKDDRFELIAEVLILLSTLLVENGVSDEYLSRTVQRLIKKFVTVSEGQKVSEKSLKLIFDFITLVWQRRTHLINTQTIETLSSSPSFCKYLKSSLASKYMIFHHCWTALCTQHVKSEALLQTIGVSIKIEEFYRLHEEQFLNSVFESFEWSFKEKTLDKEQRKWSNEFVTKYFKHQLGLWINQRKSTKKLLSEEMINAIFKGLEINEDTKKIRVQKIPKTLPEKKPEHKVALGIERMKMQQEKEESEEEQQDKNNNKKDQPQFKRSKKLVELLRARGVSVENEINYDDQDTKNCLLELFSQSYSQKQLLSFHHKVLIVQKYGQYLTYTPEQFRSDLQSQQYAIPIKLFSVQEPSAQTLSPQAVANEFLFLQQQFSFMTSNKDQLENLLFKEILRLSLIKLIEVAKAKYKQAVTFLSKYYKKLINNCKSSIEFAQVNSLVLRISQRLFTSVGNTKGKYQNLIHSHCKLLSTLINSMDLHQFSANSPVVTPVLLQHTYHQIISIFGTKQLYLINTGVIELITRKELNYQKLKFFIDQIMVKALNYQADNNKESEISMNYYEHALSIGKCLIFASFMLGSGEAEWVSSISPILTSGIARNQVAIFYGLVKDKLKRNIVRKLFLFFKLTFESKKFVQGFKNYLTTIDDHEMRKLLHIYSQIYYILLSININDDAKLMQVIEKLMDRITNFFSLDLRLTLFRPLLPNIKLYSYLNSQLKAHKQADFPQLGQLINICPNQPFLEWVNFIHQCLKRGHQMSPQCAESVFSNEHFLNDQSNFQAICELTCHLSQYSRDTLVPYVNQVMNVVLAVCQMDSNHDYCLSLLYKIIVNMQQLVDPFVGDVYKYALQCESQFVEKFISDTVEGLTVPTLIQTVKTLSKTSKHLFNFGLFFKHVCKHGVGHLLSKTLQYYASKIIHSSLQDEVDLSNLYSLASYIFLQMTMKFNENELRKVLIDFVRWSETKQNEEAGISFNMRKIFIASIFEKLSSNLGNLFTPFYGYVFDSYLKDLDLIVNSKVEKLKDGKRPRTTESSFSDLVTLNYLVKVLESLSSLFVNDTEKEFLDSTKFDILSEKLSNLFTIQRLEYGEYTQLTSSLSKCLLKLCHYLTDDYQLKSLNLKILLLLRHKVVRQQQAIFTFMDKLIDEIQDRYLLFINDLVPFLIDNVHNRNQKVKQPIKSIINKFEEMSGSKIENYLQ